MDDVARGVDGPTTDGRLNALCAASDEWRDGDALIADGEGWNVFASDSRGLAIMRDDEDGRFEDDDAAVAHVRAKAAEGSRVHAVALRIHEAQREYLGLTPGNGGRDVQVVPRDALDAAVAATHGQPWLVVFADGRIDGHASEEDACDAQRGWRALNGLDPTTGDARRSEAV